MNKLLRLSLFSSCCLFFAACVPAPATIPTTQIPSVPSPVPSIPTPSDGMPSPPSLPGLPSPSSGSDSPSPPSMPEPLPGDGEPGSDGNQASKGDGEGGQVVLEEQEGEEGSAEQGGGSESESAESDGAGAGEESESEDISLEDTASEDESAPTFEEPAASSTTQVVLDQATLEELERVLEEELGTFDTTINREQRNAEDQSNETPGGAQDIPEIVFQDYPSEGENSGSGSGGGSGSGSGGGTGGGGGGDGETVAVASAQEPPPNPDDDIVARQLREAAVAETDPELKARLWEEYYRYTGTQ